MNRRTALIALLLVCFGCATALKKEQREFVFIETTTASKADAYKNALTYLAKYINNSNQAVQIRDEQAGQIVTNISIQCAGLGAFATSALTDFTLEINTKDGKIRFVFEAIRRHDTDLYGRPFTAPFVIVDQVEKAKACASDLKDDLMKSILQKKKDW